jgi:hypothetical protein
MRQLQQEYPALSVRALCRWLRVSRGWFYAQPVVDGAAAAAERMGLPQPPNGSRCATRSSGLCWIFPATATDG